MRLAILAVLLLAVGTACGSEATQYEVTVDFNATVTQDDIDDAAALLRGYDDDVDFLILERFPPQGRAMLETDAPNFCATIETGLRAMSYVDDASCRRR